jgi:hypothetical protein
LGIVPSVAQLCFHGCWLHHAANEHYAGSTTDQRPFLKIVQWLASQRPLTIERWCYEVA